MVETAEEMRLTGYSRPASEIISVQEDKLSDYALPAARLAIAAPKADKFLEETIEQNRLRRSMGGMSTGSYGPDMDYLNSPPLRDRWEGERESENTIDARESGRVWQFASLFPMTMNQGAAKWYDPAVEAGVVNRPFYPEPTGREAGQFVSDIALDIMNSMKRLKDGIPEVKDFSPQDIMNVAGLSVAGGYARAAQGGRGLGSGGGRVGTPLTKLDIDQSPLQGVLKYAFEEGMGPHAAYRRYLVRAADKGESVTARPQGIDVSYTPNYNERIQAKVGVQVGKETDEIVGTLKKELPDLSFETHGSGRARYIDVKKGDQLILQARVADHAATRFDSVSVDPVSGNTVDTLRQVLAYETGKSNAPPVVGWSLMPAHSLRKAMNAQAGMPVFPDGRQIGGTAEYIRGGFQNSLEPYRIVDQTIGTDIQWQFPATQSR